MNYDNFQVLTKSLFQACGIEDSKIYKKDDYTCVDLIFYYKGFESEETPFFTCGYFEACNPMNHYPAGVFKRKTACRISEKEAGVIEFEKEFYALPKVIQKQLKDYAEKYASIKERNF